MARLEDLRRGATVEGIRPDRLETIVDDKWHGPTVVEVTYKDASGRLANELLYRDRKPTKGVLPKEYARPALDRQRLGRRIDLVTNIHLGGGDNHAQDMLGRVYEYFLGQFASAQGKTGGEFYTPRCIVKLLVEMLRPYKGWVYDPCCSSSGMFVQSEEFIPAHGGRIGDVSIYGQELNYTTWRLAKMNLAIRGIDGRIEQGDSFANDRSRDLEADYILANPPFNMKHWGGEGLPDDKRWRYGGTATCSRRGATSGLHPMNRKTRASPSRKRWPARGATARAAGRGGQTRRSRLEEPEGAGYDA